MLSGITLEMFSDFLVQETVDEITAKKASESKSTLIEMNGLRMACLILNTGKKSEFIFGLSTGESNGKGKHFLTFYVTIATKKKKLIMLPLFPLQIVVYPGEKLNLHIFEPRYKQLMQACENENITFGIVPFLDGRLTSFGTEVVLTEVQKRYDNGELDVRTQGIGLFHLDEFFKTAPGKLYPGGDVTRVDIVYDGTKKLGGHLLSMVRSLFSMLSIEKELPADPDRFLAYDIGHYVGLSQQQEYELLCITQENERREYLIEHLEHLLPLVRETEELKRKARMNGHFRNLTPPEFL